MAMTLEHRAHLSAALDRLGDAQLDVAALSTFLEEREADPSSVAEDRLDDLVLAWACGHGSRPAIAAFREAHVAMVRAIGARLLDGIQPEDFEQRVMTHLLVREGEATPRIERYRGRGTLRAFVRMVASRLAFDVRRALGVGPVALTNLEGRLADELQIGDAIETAEAKALLGDAVQQALRSLRPVERRALRMRYVLGFSVARTATALNMHEVSVSRLVTRVRSRVLEMVQHQLATTGGAPLAGQLAALVRSLDLSVARWLETNPG